MTEFGRSMVEMLGVLAVMSVITMGGMAGYQVAMNKLKSNNIVEVISEASIEAQKKGEALSLEELDLDETAECIDSLTGYPGGQVKVVFKNTDHCKKIMALSSTSFAKCRWLEEGALTRRYVPERSSECKEEDAHGKCLRYECDPWEKEE